MAGERKQPSESTIIGVAVNRRSWGVTVMVNDRPGPAGGQMTTMTTEQARQVAESILDAADTVDRLRRGAS